MNSSTTSSDPHRRYVLVDGAGGGPVGGVLGLGIYLQPVQGDLTRIGAYPERQFGWNQPQPAYASPLGTLADYRQPVDLLVLGDSYSAGGWQYHLTGGGARSQLSLHFEQVTLEQILAHPRYQADPPQVLIYQVVERSLPVRLLSQPCDPVGAEGAPAPSSSGPWRPARMGRRWPDRPVARTGGKCGWPPPPAICSSQDCGAWAWK